MDYLKNLSLDELAAFYLRLADSCEKLVPSLDNPLSGKFLRTYILNRDRGKVYEFETPSHFKQHQSIFETQKYHRDVFLTNKKAEFEGSSNRWVGVLPRIQGTNGFPKWDPSSGWLTLEIETLCDNTPNGFAIVKAQQRGSDADRDILTSVRGFQLKSTVKMAVSQVQNSSALMCSFKSWVSSGKDLYDFSSAEHFTFPNPDYGSKLAGAIRPQDDKITVHHSNAQRLEAAGRAMPFTVVLKPWLVSDARLLGPANIDPKRKL